MRKLFVAVLLCAASAFGGTSTVTRTPTMIRSPYASLGGGGLLETYFNVRVKAESDSTLDPYYWRRTVTIVEFDTSAIPAGTVTSATMTMTPTSYSYPTGCTFYGAYMHGINIADPSSVVLYWPESVGYGDGLAFATALPTGWTPAVYTLGNLNKFSTYTQIRLWAQYCSGDPLFVDNNYTVSLSITYTTNTAPVTVSSSGLPANFNIGTEQTIVATVRDADGYANINYFHVLLSYGVDGAYSCYFLVYPNSNYFHLMNDAGDSWGPGYTFGVAGTAANSSCKVNAATSSRSVSGTDATVTLKITFLPGVFSRPSRPLAAVNSYLWVMDAAAAGQVWGGPYQQATARSGPKLIVTSQR